MQNLHVSPILLGSLGAILFLLVMLAVIGKVPLAYNIRNLVVRWWITVLTAMAFTLVVGLLTAMLAFVNGMNKMTESTGHPGNVIVLSDGATDELFSNLLYSDTNNIENQPGVERAELGSQSREIPLCSKEVYIVVNQAVPAKENQPERRRFVQVRGIEDARVSQAVHELELLDGKWFSDVGVEDLQKKPDQKSAETAIQAVLGEGVARVLGEDANKKSLEVGDTFELGSRKWVVTGVMKSSGSTFGSEVWAKRSIVGPMFGKDQITSLVLRSKDSKAAEAIADDLSKNFKPAVRAEPETVYYSKLTQTNDQFRIAIYFVAVFMAIGGVFGVMNTMFAAISQRTKDIGTLRILGFARWQVLISFFLETMCIALFGGLLGCALGYAFDGVTATSILSSGQGGGKTVVLKMVVDPNTLAIGILFSVIMGAVGGFVPAISAMRLRPLESLR